MAEQVAMVQSPASAAGHKRSAQTEVRLRDRLVTVYRGLTTRSSRPADWTAADGRSCVCRGP